MEECYKKILILFIWVLIIVLPLPFLSNLLINEEGSYAYLAIDNGRAKIVDHHNVLLIGRENGRDRWDVPEHPILPYLFFIKIIRPLTSGLNFSNLSITQKTVIARLPFYFLYGLSWILIFWMNKWLFTLKNVNSLLLPLGFLGFVGTWRLIVGGGVQTIFDGNYGLLLTSLSAVGLYWASKLTSLFPKILLFFFSGAIAGLGKNEWALAMLMALGLIFLFVLIYRKAFLSERPLLEKDFSIFFLAVLLGLLVGVAFNYFMDPSNYFSGFNVMHRFTLYSSTNSYFSFFYRLPWVWPHFLFFFFGFFLLGQDFKYQVTLGAPQFLLFLWGTIQMIGFLITPHLGDGFPRYFCPSFIALFLFIMSCLEKREILFKKMFLIVIFLYLGTGYNLYHLGHAYYSGISIGSIPGVSLADRQAIYEKDYHQFLQTRQVKKTDAAAGYYFPDFDFQNNS